MNLHDIKTNTQSIVWAWCSTQRGTVTNFFHAYPVERRTPPPLGTEARRRWNPYYDAWDNHLITTPTTPLCGKLRTRARNPEAALAYRDAWRDRRCPACFALAPNTVYVQELYDRDPWYTTREQLARRGLPWAEYTQALMNLVDPVTGA